MSQIYKNIKNSASKDFQSYATQADLPLSGVTDGTIAYVEDVRTIYIFDDFAWYGIRLKNDAPVITDAPPERVIVTKFSTYTYELIGEDPDGLPLSWSYEVIEGPTTGYTLSFIGSTLNLTNNTSGTAIVVKFTASDGTNVATTTTRFVLDTQEGVQGSVLNNSTAVNLSTALLGWQTTDNGLQYSANGDWKFRLHSGDMHVMDNTKFFTTATPTSQKGSDFNNFLVNGRLFRGTVGQFQEYDPATFNSIGTHTIDTRSQATDFSNSINVQEFVVEDDSIIYNVGWDRGNPIGFDVWAVLVPNSGALTPLASTFRVNITDVDPNGALYTRAMQVTGDKLVILASASGNANVVWYVFDKNTLTLLGRTVMSSTTFGGGISGTCATTACQNLFFYANGGDVRVFDITDPSNVTKVTTNLPAQFTASNAGGINYMSERLVTIHEDAAHLFDVDSIRGNITYVTSNLNVAAYNSPGSNFRYPTKLIGGGMFVGSINSSYTHVYQLFSTDPTPPFATNIPEIINMNLGETYNLTIDGQEATGGTVTYLAVVNNPAITEGTLTGSFSLDGTTGELSFTPTTRFDYDATVRIRLSHDGDFTYYFPRFIVSDTVGPGSTLNSYVSNQAGTIYSTDNAPVYYGNGTVIRDRAVFSRIESGTVVVPNVDNGSTNGDWATAVHHDGIVYYKSSTEIYLFTQNDVYRLADLSDTTYEAGSSVYNITAFDMTDPLTGYRGYWWESPYETDVLWYITHENNYIKFDTSSPSSWTALASGTPILASPPYTPPTDGNYHVSDNGRYVMLQVDSNADGVAGANIRYYILDTSPSNTYFLRQWYWPDVELPADVTFEQTKFVIIDEYIFICNTNQGTITGDGSPARYTLFVYRITAIETVRTLETTLVETITFPATVADLKFKDSVLYILFEGSTAYVNTYDWDYVNETLTLVDTLNYVRDGSEGTLGVDSNSVYITSGDNNGASSPNLTRLKGA